MNSEEKWNNQNDLVEFLSERRSSRIEGYQANPVDLQEHVATEKRVTESGYTERQVNELIQNAIDAITAGKREDRWTGSDDPRVDIILTSDALYAANNGAPLDKDGLTALLQANISEKEDQIGRFGIGFKSLLAYTDSPKIFSRTISVLFDRDRSRRLLEERLSSPFEESPALRIGWATDPSESFGNDEILNEMKDWAATLIKVPFDADHVGQPATLIRKQFENFRAECALFDKFSSRINFRDKRDNWTRKIHTDWDGNYAGLEDQGEVSLWQVFERRIDWDDLSKKAKDDGGSLYERSEIPIQWAVPMEETPEARTFWSWFPLSEENRIPGILNSFWKTNDDRQNILNTELSAYNEELLDEAADLVADSIPECHSTEEPGFITDLYPREEGGNQETAGFLAQSVWDRLKDKCIVPDANDDLRKVQNIKRQPAKAGSDPVQKWDELAMDDKRSEYVHPEVFSRERAARYRTLIEIDDQDETFPDLTDWIQACVDNSSEGSKRGIEVLEAVLQENFDSAIKDNYSRKEIEQAKKSSLVYTKSNQLVPPTSELYFQTQQSGNMDPRKIVHPDLEEEPYKDILRNTFDVAEYDPIESRGNTLHSFIDRDDPKWDKFWSKLSDYPENNRPSILESVKKKISYSDEVWVKNECGSWTTSDSVIWPDDELDADRMSEEDSEYFVDSQYHDEHKQAIKEVLEVPQEPAHGKFYLRKLNDYQDLVNDHYRQECAHVGGSTKYHSDKLKTTNRNRLEWFEKIVAQEYRNMSHQYFWRNPITCPPRL
jgi:hypothetical protein